MQRTNHLKHTELLASIKKAKSDIFEVLLAAFQEGHQDEKRHPYEVAKGRIFNDFWTYLESLPSSQFLQPYEDLEKLILLDQFIKPHLSEKMGKTDISENKKNVLKEVMRFFYDLQRSHVLLCSQQHFFAAFEMQEESVSIVKECEKYKKQLTAHEDSLSEYSDRLGVIKLMDLHIGISSLLPALHLNVPNALTEQTAHKKTPVAFLRMQALLNKVRERKVEAALRQYQAESGQPRETAYRQELQTFVLSLNEEREILAAVIGNFHAKYIQFKQQLLLLDNKLQLINDREQKIQDCFDLIARVDVNPVSTTGIMAICDAQVVMPVFMGRAMETASFNLLKTSPWNQASQKINECLQDVHGKLASYVNSFSEEFVLVALRGMRQNKQIVVDQLRLLQLVDDTITLWANCVRCMRAESGNILGQIQPPKSCCFLFGLFRASSSDEAKQSLLGDNLLDLKIQEDRLQEIAGMSQAIEECADQEEPALRRAPAKREELASKNRSSAMYAKYNRP
ncbi:MAG: hypothetical protein WAW86_01305 [Gammaproteobacteria bacterium]